MHASTVVIAAGERSIEAVLAAEALRRAARQRGLELMIEIRSDQGVTGALPASDAASPTQLLLVGDGEADIARFGNARIVHASLGEVLTIRSPRLHRSQLRRPVPRHRGWQAHRCRHLLPHRHRSHLHGSRRPATGCQSAGPCDPG